MRQQQRILHWQSANGKYNVGNVVVQRIRSVLDGGTSNIDKRMSLMCPAKIMA